MVWNVSKTEGRSMFQGRGTHFRKWAEHFVSQKLGDLCLRKTKQNKISSHPRVSTKERNRKQFHSSELGKTELGKGHLPEGEGRLLA